MRLSQIEIILQILALIVHYLGRPDLFLLWFLHATAPHRKILNVTKKEYIRMVFFYILQKKVNVPKIFFLPIRPLYS